MKRVKYTKIDLEYNISMIDEYHKKSKNKNPTEEDKKELSDMKQEVKTWVLESDGINILELMNSEYVDHTRTISNDIHEMLFLVSPKL